MELVEGETLSERIARGRLSMEEAISVFRQIEERQYDAAGLLKTTLTTTLTRDTAGRVSSAELVGA